MKVVPYAAALLLIGFRSYAVGSSCVRPEKSDSFLRELLKSAADAPSSNDRTKMCYEIARSAGKISAASDYVLRYYDVELKGVLAATLRNCKPKIELAKAACGDFSASVDTEARRRLEAADIGQLRGIYKDASDCLKQGVHASLAKAADGSGTSSSAE